MTTRHSLVRCACFLALLVASHAGASYHTFGLDEVYSNADGNIQYIVLRERLAADDQHVLLGHVLAVAHAGVLKTFTLEHNLASSATAGRRVLIATPAFAALNLVTPDYVIPPQFVPVDGGTLDYASVDLWTFPALPSDGVNALFRDGTIGANSATNFAGQTAAASASPITVVEYYNAALDHYFVSGLALDIDALDSGRIAGWTRTGYSFNAFPDRAVANASPVCRFYIPPQHGNSHFFSASPAECEDILRRVAVDPNYSGYIYESPNVYYVALPDASSGACAAGTVPVYRLWNGRADSNHRYTSDPVVKSRMVAMGYTAEGYGPEAVSLCAVGSAAIMSEFRATGATPFTVGCELVASTGTLYPGSEVEPYIAVDPTDANHLIGVWQQDRWSNGGARGLVSAYSFDGGVTWTRNSAPFSRCNGGNAANGGDYARSSDPWVTFSPDGSAYQIALSLNGSTFQTGSSNAVLVSRSTDGGRSWSNPLTLIRDDSSRFNDKESITADAVDSRYVYAVWDRLTPGGQGPSYFSRTSDAGVSWEAPRAIYDPGQNSQTIGNVIVALPDATLVNLFVQLDVVGDRVTATLKVIRSFDRGSTWSAPITIAPHLAVGTNDPDTASPIRDSLNIAAIAAGSQGQIAVAWQDSRFSGGARDGIALSMSRDGGTTWSTPVQVNRDASTQAFVPSVSFLMDGTVGVTYYDLRANTTQPGTLPTHYWLVTSSDGVRWREYHIGGPFNLNVAPRVGGAALFLGDYQGLASNGTTFIALFARTNEGDLTNQTDIFSTVAGSTVIANGSTSELKDARPFVGGHAGSPTTGHPFAALPAESFTPSRQLERRISDGIIRAMQRRLPGWTMRGTGEQVTPAPSN